MDVVKLVVIVALALCVAFGWPGVAQSNVTDGSDAVSMLCASGSLTIQT